MTDTLVRCIMLLWDWIHYCRYLVIGSVLKVTPKVTLTTSDLDKNTLENVAFYQQLFLVALFCEQNLQSH